jgi:hypothetical protein
VAVIHFFEPQSVVAVAANDPLLLALSSYRPTVFGRHPEEHFSRRRISFLPAPKPKQDGVQSRRRFALENADGAGGCGKAAAWPPHSKMGWVALYFRTLRDTWRGGHRASAS